MNTGNKIKVAVVMGGYSAENHISLKSGKTVSGELGRLEKYEVFPIHITPEGWFHPATDVNIPVDRSDFSIRKDGEKITFDVVFNVIHGHPGEDGLLPAYFELLGIPHTSDHSYLMALTFNKKDCISVLDTYGIPHAVSLRFRRGDKIDHDRIAGQIGFPCFVKANRSGSSFGISKVHRKEELQAAIEKAFAEDSEIIIEQFLDGTEVSVGVITYRGKVKVLPITEIIPETDYFDYEAKYLGKSEEITPARIDDTLTRNVSELACKVYESLGLKGMSRAEYILVDGTPYFLEINTVPGFTNESILPQQLRAAGLDMGDYLDDLITQSIRQKL